MDIITATYDSDGNAYITIPDAYVDTFLYMIARGRRSIMEPNPLVSDCYRTRAHHIMTALDNDLNG